MKEIQMMTLIITIKKQIMKKNDKNRIKYVIAAYFFNKSLIYLLMRQHSFSSNKANKAQYFIFD